MHQLNEAINKNLTTVYKFLKDNEMSLNVAKTMMMGDSHPNKAKGKMFS